MRAVLALSLLLVSGVSNSAHSQQAAPVPATDNSNNPRVYVTDSNSWSIQSASGGGFGGFAGGFGTESGGGARPQTAEIIKTFGQRCPQVTVNNKLDVANYVVELDHEGGKGILSHKDKIAVFVQRTGDSIFSESTLSVGGSVQDACAAVLAHWAAHAAELKAAAAAHAQAAVAAPAPAAAAPSITVDASVPNCDIEVDGSFMGSTPSTISLAPGKHDIVVKKTGFKDWSRNMTVTGGTIRVSAEMAAAQ
jgi:hypothetical protein